MKKFDGRWLALDIIKAVGIILIVIEHIVVWWFIDLDYGTDNPFFNKNFFFVFLNSIIVFTALVPAAAGASLRFYLMPVLDDNKRTAVKSIYHKRIIVRAFILASLGYLLNYLAFGVEDAFAWDVLQFLALCFVVAVVIIKWGSILLLAVIGALNLILAPYLREILGNYQSRYWMIMLFGNQSGDHFWPFFPWFSIFVFGFLIGNYYLYFRSKNKLLHMHALFFLVGMFFLGLAVLNNKVFVDIDQTNFWGPNIFQPSTLTIIGGFGLALLVITLVNAGFSGIKKFRKYGIISSFSKGVLWIFIFHTIVGYNLLLLLKNSVLYSLYALFFVIVFMLIFCYLIGIVCVWLKENGVKVNF